jgi:hypothetical protein
LNTPPATPPALDTVFLNRATVARLLGVSYDTLTRMSDRGEGPRFFKIGKRDFVTVDGFKEWIRERQQAARLEAEINADKPRGRGALPKDKFSHFAA